MADVQLCSKISSVLNISLYLKLNRGQFLICSLKHATRLFCSVYFSTELKHFHNSLFRNKFRNSNT